jgi:hypothetical protein
MAKGKLLSMMISQTGSRFVQKKLEEMTSPEIHSMCDFIILELKN